MGGIRVVAECRRVGRMGVGVRGEEKEGTCGLNIYFFDGETWGSDFSIDFLAVVDAETWGPDFSGEFCSFLDAEIWGPDFSIDFLALVGC